MTQFGHFALCLGWFLTLIGMVTGIYAARTNSRRWAMTARNSTILTFFSLAAAIFSLAYAFSTDDYSNQYVWQFSNKAMEGMYKVSAIWGGMDGSMLLWAVMLALSSAVVAWHSVSYPTRLMPWVLVVLNSSICFFTTVVVFFTNPFRYIKASFIPPDGNGLNPLLQNPFMAIHPPTLYAGFTTFAIPYAFGLAALLSGSLTNDWIRLTRRWTLIAWMFLTAGIVLGGHWAYIELGWGGFWAWDPVENASFLPWLTGTAFLHSVMVQERKNMLRFWNIWLVVGTYGLTVFGTFLTRSGVVQSVHAFASTDMGWVFLAYLAVIGLITAGLTIYRRHDLKSERRIESLFSREAAFLVNNLLFLSICFATTWGVLFPVLSEAVTGTKQTVGIPFFNAVNIPFFLLLIFLMGVGPLIAWRKATLQSLRRTFLWPFVMGLALSMLLVWAGITEFYPVLSYGLCFFVFMTILGEFHRGLKVQRAALGETPAPIGSGVASLFRRHRHRYGGYLVHLGVVVVTVAITASMAHKTEKEFVLEKGGTYDIGRFSIRLDDFFSAENDNYEALIAKTTILPRGGGEPLGELRPELRVYKRNKETTTEVALRMGAREDLYLVLGGLDGDGKRAALKVFINPLQVWLWFGAIMMVFGTLVILIPGATAPVAVFDDGRKKSVPA